MGKYDIEAKYDEECKLTLADLCNEILDEVDVSPEDKRWPTEEKIRDKFKNYDKSGLLDKLKNKNGFDMEGIAGRAPLELFDMFKILKLLYYIEKAGAPKYKHVDSSKTRIQITDILAKPRLENIPSEFADTSVYGSIFADLFDKIKKIVGDADNRCLRLDIVNSQWEYITEKLFDYVITDRALEEPEKAIKELDRINRFLKEKVLERLPKSDVVEKMRTEGVMSTFFNILACHRVLCNEVDRIKINYQIQLSDSPSREYIDNFKKYEACEVRWELLPIISKRLAGESVNSEAEIVLYFISYGLEIPDTEVSNYRYAVKYAKTVASWIEKHKQVDFSKGISLGMLSTIMQEIMDCKKDSVKIVNDYYGYNGNPKSMKTALTKPKVADAIIRQAWIKKLENRAAINYGAYNLIEKKREIETTIYEVKKILFSYRNLDDLEFVSDMLSHFVARSLTSRELAMEVGAHFRDSIAKKLCGAAEKIRDFQMWPEGINVLDMFREFLVDNSIEETVALEVAKLVNGFYEEDSTVCGKSMSCSFEVNHGERYHHEFFFVFYVDKSKDCIVFQQFVEVVPDEVIARMTQLGLERFVKGIR